MRAACGGDGRAHRFKAPGRNRQQALPSVHTWPRAPGAGDAGHRSTTLRRDAAHDRPSSSALRGFGIRCPVCRCPTPSARPKAVRPPARSSSHPLRAREAPCTSGNIRTRSPENSGTPTSMPSWQARRTPLCISAMLKPEMQVAIYDSGRQEALHEEIPGRAGHEDLHRAPWLDAVLDRQCQRLES